MKKYLGISVVVILAVVFGGNAVMAKDEPSGSPFEAIWKAIDYLQSQISQISLIPGPQGPKGDIGPSGLPGHQGIAGPMGPQGIQGETGLTGPAGPRGFKGEDGKDAQTGAGNIAFTFKNEEGINVLMNNGQVWLGDISQVPVNWSKRDEYNPSMSPADIVQWKLDNYLDKAGDVWVWTETSISRSRQPIDYNNTNDNSEESVYTGVTSKFVSQSFIASKNYTITAIKLKAFKAVGTPSTWIVAIYAVNGSHKPTGTSLCSGTIDANTFTSSPGLWYEISFGGGYDLTLGIEYVIVISTDTDVNNRSAWRCTDWGSVYHGYNFHSEDFSTWYSNGWESADTMFETYESEASYEFINIGSPPAE